MRESANEEVGMREKESKSERKSKRERERENERARERKKKERKRQTGIYKKSVEKNFYFIRNVIVCECACVD